MTYCYGFRRLIIVSGKAPRFSADKGPAPRKREPSEGFPCLNSLKVEEAKPNSRFPRAMAQGVNALALENTKPET